MADDEAGNRSRFVEMFGGWVEMPTSPGVRRVTLNFDDQGQIAKAEVDGRWVRVHRKRPPGVED